MWTSCIFIMHCWRNELFGSCSLIGFLFPWPSACSSWNEIDTRDHHQSTIVIDTCVVFTLGTKLFIFIGHPILQIRTAYCFTFGGTAVIYTFLQPLYFLPPLVGKKNPSLLLSTDPFSASLTATPASRFQITGTSFVRVCLFARCDIFAYIQNV